MSLIQWPFKRKEYPGFGNPRFVSDIVAANEATIDAMKALTGLGATDFAIITGLEYTSGVPSGTYAPGIFYLNGSFYYLGGSFSEGLYLAPNPTDIMPKPFSDGNSRLTYTLLNGIATSNPAGSTPIFSSTMNQYRIGLKSVNANVLAMQAILATLGNSAFLNVGTTSGTVAAGNDSRFGYTVAQIDNLFAKKADVIVKGAGTAYTPSAGTDPVNKQYADAATGSKLLWLGNISSDGSTAQKLAPSSGGLTVSSSRIGAGHYLISHNNGNNNFFVNGIGVDQGTRFASPRSYDFESVNSFAVYTSNDGSADDCTFQLSIFQYF